MIVLKRYKPDDLIGYEFLSRRFPDNLEFRRKVRILKAGYRGECRADREWDEIELPKQHYLFHDYESISKTKVRVQMDTIYLCRNFILIVEIKNIAGTVIFENPQHQFIRIGEDGEMESFTNPINQVMRHRQWMYELIKPLSIRIPIIPTVVFANSTTIIKNAPSQYSVFHLSGLRQELKRWHEQMPPKLSISQLEEVRNLLQSNYQRKLFSLPLTMQSLEKRAQCDSCLQPLSYKRNKILCQKCGQKPPELFYQLLNEYRVIWGEWICNNDLRGYLGIKGCSSASKVLKKYNFDKKGSFRSTCYHIPRSIQDELDLVDFDDLEKVE